MGTKQERINKIIDIMEKDRHYDSETTAMTHDGIVGSESQYTGITVVLKEVPDPDFAGEVSNPEGIRAENEFGYNLNSVKYAIDRAMNGEDFNQTDCDASRTNIISGIGYVDIKKKAESHGTTPDSDVYKYAKNDGKYLRAQINTLQPKVIYCSGKNSVYNSVMSMYSEFAGKEVYNKDNVHVFMNNGKRLIIIDGYHVSPPGANTYLDPKGIHSSLKEALKATENLEDKNNNKDFFDDIPVDNELESKIKNYSLDKNNVNTTARLSAKSQNFSMNKSSSNVGGGIQGGSFPIKQILIIILIILLLLLGFFLLRSCGGCSTRTSLLEEKTSTPQPLPPVPESEPLIDETLVFSEKTEMLFVANLPDLLPAASGWLNGVATELSKYLDKNPGAVFQVIGYSAIAPGLPDPNKLSQERANKIVSELITRKININNIQAISGGETNRWGNNIDELSRAPNRRIVIQQKK